MHELSLCQSIYGITDRAREGRPVVTVRLRVGALRQVVPETLKYCWGVVTDTTPLANLSAHLADPWTNNVVTNELARSGGGLSGFSYIN